MTNYRSFHHFLFRLWCRSKMTSSPLRHTADDSISSLLLYLQRTVSVNGPPQLVVSHNLLMEMSDPQTVSEYPLRSIRLVLLIFHLYRKLLHWMYTLLLYPASRVSDCRFFSWPLQIFLTHSCFSFFYTPFPYC